MRPTLFAFGGEGKGTTGRDIRGAGSLHAEYGHMSLISRPVSDGTEWVGMLHRLLCFPLKMLRLCLPVNAPSHFTLSPSLFGLPRTIKRAAHNKSESGSAHLFPVAFLYRVSCLPLALLLTSLAEGWVTEHKPRSPWQEQFVCVCVGGKYSWLSCEKELDKQKAKKKKKSDQTNRESGCLPRRDISA